MKYICGLVSGHYTGVLCLSEHYYSSNVVTCPLGAHVFGHLVSCCWLHLESSWGKTGESESLGTASRSRQLSSFCSNSSELRRPSHVFLPPQNYPDKPFSLSYFPASVCHTEENLTDTNTKVQTVAGSSRTTSEGGITRKTNQGLRELELLALPPIEERRGEDGVAHHLPMI